MAKISTNGIHAYVNGTEISGVKKIVLEDETTIEIIDAPVPPSALPISGETSLTRRARHLA